MDIKIEPSFLKGSLCAPPSKSISHRALICAALSEGKSELTDILDCEDTRATADALKALGAKIEKSGNKTLVTGIPHGAGDISVKAEINCRESGSTLRFMLPVAAALGRNAVFSGEANLPNRPITPYLEQFPKHGVIFASEKMPYEISGRLTAGEYPVTGSISSQFITGYILALPMIGGGSVKVTSELESRPYVTLTADVMRSFGVEVSEKDSRFETAGSYKPRDYAVEADMSQAAFFLVASAIGADVRLTNLNAHSVQGDAEMIDITGRFKANGGKAFDTDASDIPDLVPILAVLACFAEGTSHITGCGRLRIKESDRLAAMTDELNRLGGRLTAGADSLTIEGVKELKGGECLTYSDHRIAMSLAIASQRCTAPVVIKGAECVNKSYPAFFEDFAKLGGKTYVV